MLEPPSVPHAASAHSVATVSGNSSNSSLFWRSASGAAEEPKSSSSGRIFKQMSRDAMFEVQKVTGTSVQEKLGEFMYNGHVMASNIKTSAREAKSGLVSKFVNALDLNTPDEVKCEAGLEPAATKPKDEQRRRWQAARRAAHREHRLQDDPPVPKPGEHSACAIAAAKAVREDPSSDSDGATVAAPLIPPTASMPLGGAAPPTASCPPPTASCPVGSVAPFRRGHSPKGAKAVVPEAMVPRGVLEIEILAFSGDPLFVCADETKARLPVAQLVLGERVTGALRPRSSEPLAAMRAGASSRSASCDPAGDSPPVRARGDSPTCFPLAAVRCFSPSPAAGKWPAPETAAAAGKDKGQAATWSARFLMEEVGGSDLRLHVFDMLHPKFSLGLEDRAFCGGALIPLSILHHRGRVVAPDDETASRGGGARGAVSLFARTLEAEVGVRLLPLDTLEEKKYATIKVPHKRVVAGLPSLGSVLLRLRLHLYTVTLPRMLVQDFRKKPRTIVSAKDQTVRLDDPRTVMTAAAMAMSRMNAATNFSLYRRSWAALRHDVHIRSWLLALWTFAVFSSVWQLPGCLVLAWGTVLWQVSELAAADLVASPPLFLQEEEEKQSLQERGRTKIRQMVDMELRLVRFARQLTIWSSRLEKVRFICSLRDPYISMAFGGIAVVAAMCMSFGFLFLSLVPYDLGLPLCVWATGVAALLPDRYQEKLRDLVLALKAAKERSFGPDKWAPAIKNLWRRVPDQLEAKHWDLFASGVLLPAAEP